MALRFIAQISALIFGACFIVPHADAGVEFAKIFGKIQVVESFPDYKVKIVQSFPDLRVRVATSFPNRPGKWQFVKSFPDFTVKFVESGEDFTIQFVNLVGIDKNSIKP